MKFEKAILEYSPEEVPYQPGGRESSIPCARFLEADWVTHGHVTRARDCHVVVTRSAALSSCDKYGYCPVNVSRAVGPRCVDRAINNLSND